MAWSNFNDGERFIMTLKKRHAAHGWIVSGNTLRKLFISHIEIYTSDFGDVDEMCVCWDKPLKDKELAVNSLRPRIMVCKENILTEKSDIIKTLLVTDDFIVNNHKRLFL